MTTIHFNLYGTCRLCGAQDGALTTRVGEVTCRRCAMLLERVHKYIHEPQPDVTPPGGGDADARA